MCLGKEVPWATSKRAIFINDFSAEARLWLAIICRIVFPCTHMTAIIDLCAWMVACILSGIHLNIGKIVLSD